MGMIGILILAAFLISLLYLAVVLPRLDRRTPRDRELSRDPDTQPRT